MKKKGDFVRRVADASPNAYRAILTIASPAIFLLLTLAALLSCIAVAGREWADYRWPEVADSMRWVWRAFKAGKPIR